MRRSQNTVASLSASLLNDQGGQPSRWKYHAATWTAFRPLPGKERLSTQVALRKVVHGRSQNVLPVTMLERTKARTRWDARRRDGGDAGIASNPRPVLESRSTQPAAHLPIRVTGRDRNQPPVRGLLVSGTFSGSSLPLTLIFTGPPGPSLMPRPLLSPGWPL